MYPFFIIVILTFCASWLIIALRVFSAGNELLRAFCGRYPDEARVRIPHAFTGMRHPQKVMYFLSSQSRRFLEEKQDEGLLSRRRSLVKLLSMFLSLHLGAMLVLGILFAVTK
jgi:hypothetical protein